MEEYFIHDNGGRPFKVTINSETNELIIYKRLDQDDPYECIEYEYQLNKYDEEDQYVDGYLIDIYSNVPLFIFNYMKVFIGKSPENKMTLFSGSANKHETIGNSILAQITNNKYLIIGWDIYTFTCDSEIEYFISPVGNSDVPYPYAIAKNNDIYCFYSKILLKNIMINNKNTILDDNNISNRSFDQNECHIPNIIIIQERII